MYEWWKRVNHSAYTIKLNKLNQEISKRGIHLIMITWAIREWKCDDAMSMMPFKARLFPDHLVSDLSKIVHTSNVILQRRTKRNIIFYGFSLLCAPIECRSHHRPWIIKNKIKWYLYFMSRLCFYAFPISGFYHHFTWNNIFPFDLSSNEKLLQAKRKYPSSSNSSIEPSNEWHAAAAW